MADFDAEVFQRGKRLGGQIAVGILLEKLNGAPADRTEQLVYEFCKSYGRSPAIVDERWDSYDGEVRDADELEALADEEDACEPASEPRVPLRGTSPLEWAIACLNTTGEVPAPE